MIRSLLKLQFKLAILPLRVARKVVRVLLDARSSETASSSGVFEAESTSSEAPAPEPSSMASEPSPLDFQVLPSEVIRRVGDGEKLTFVDVRQADELAASGMIEGALHIPTQDLPRRMTEIDQDTEFFVYCAAGVRSLDATVFLREKGYSQAWSLGGGLPSWQQDGGEVVQP